MYIMYGTHSGSSGFTLLHEAKAIEVINRSPKIWETSVPTCPFKRLTRTIFFHPLLFAYINSVIDKDQFELENRIYFSLSCSDANTSLLITDYLFKHLFPRPSLNK